MNKLCLLKHYIEWINRRSGSMLSGTWTSGRSPTAIEPSQHPWLVSSRPSPIMKITLALNSTPPSVKSFQYLVWIPLYTLEVSLLQTLHMPMLHEQKEGIKNECRLILWVSLTRLWQLTHTQCPWTTKGTHQSLFCNMFTHLHITMASASTKQGHPHIYIWFIEHCQDQMLTVSYRRHFQVQFA